MLNSGIYRHVDIKTIYIKKILSHAFEILHLYNDATFFGQENMCWESRCHIDLMLTITVIATKYFQHTNQHILSLSRAQTE